MLKKIILMTAASICLMSITQNATAAGTFGQIDEAQLVAATGTVFVTKRQIFPAIRNSNYDLTDLLRDCIFPYLDGHDLVAFVEAVHFPSLGARIYREIENRYQERVDAILINAVAGNTCDTDLSFIATLLQKKNVIANPHRSLSISAIKNIANYCINYHGENAAIDANVIDKLQSIANLENPTNTSDLELIAAGYTQHQSPDDMLRAMQIGSQLTTASPDCVTSIMNTLGDLLGQRQSGNTMPIGPLSAESALINILQTVPPTELKHAARGTLNFIETAFGVNPKNGWSHVYTKADHLNNCVNIIPSICRIPSCHLEDYLFVAEVIMYGNDQMSSVEKKAILSHLAGIPYDSLEATKDIVLDFKRDPRTANIPASSIIQLLEQTTLKEIQRDIGDLKQILTNDADGNTKIVDALNGVMRVNRQPVLNAVFQFLTGQPNAVRRSDMISSFNGKVDYLNQYAHIARMFVSELDECMRSMVINELTTIAPNDLDSVAAAALKFLKQINGHNGAIRTRTIRFLGEIKKDPLKGAHFQDYVKTLHMINALLKADYVEEVCTMSGEISRVNRFNSMQVLVDLKYIPHDHLEGISKTARYFVKSYPHLKSNQTIVSALGQASFEHLDEYINAIPRLSTKDKMEGIYGQSILRILTNIKYDILDSVVEAASQKITNKIAEQQAIGETLSFEEIEKIINACEEDEKSKTRWW